MRGESLLPRGGVRHLPFENAIDPEPPNSAPCPLSNPDDEGAPCPPTDRGVMHAGEPQSEGDEEDVKGVEGLIEVVAEEAEGRRHQDSEGDERLRKLEISSVPKKSMGGKRERLTAQPQTNGG